MELDIKFRAALYGSGALLLSFVVILSATSLGFSPAVSPSVAPSSPNTLSVLMTDPPSVPYGVTAVYLSYSNLALHISGFPADGGLVKLNAQGTLDTMSLVNTSRTISTENVPTGRYDLLMFRISSVVVTFQGRNYSATASNGNLLVPIVGKLLVNGSGPNAVLIDVQPSVVNVGTRPDPRFVMTTGARALQVPPREVGPNFNEVGHREPLQTKGWYTSFNARHSSTLSMSAALLTSRSFSLTLTNPTLDDLPIRAIILTPDDRGPHNTTPPPSLADSTVFAVNRDGSLTLVHLDLSKKDSGHNLINLFSASNYQLNAGGSFTFTFSGALATSFSSTQIRTGSSYFVSVVTNQVITLGTVKSG